MALFDIDLNKVSYMLVVTVTLVIFTCNSLYLNRQTTKSSKHLILQLKLKDHSVLKLFTGFANAAFND